MVRASYERVAIGVTGPTVMATMARWRQVQRVVENFEDEQDARERYEAMKMICALDYGFHIYMENIDD